jgi:hypothetical protein
LATAAEVEGVSGRYFAGRKVRKSNATSYDATTTSRLWDVSAGLVGMATEPLH